MNTMHSFGLPFSITRYLCGKWTERTIFVYLIVNNEGFITDWSENITPFYGIKPNKNQPAEEQLLFLYGLYPYQSHEVLILDAVNFDTQRAADVHIVPSESGELCILMFDVTETLELRRQLQQKSNDIQILYEQELRSIQNLRQAYQEAQKQQQKAENANRAKSEFFSQITHDLKSPLTAILGFAQLLELPAQNLTNEQQNYVLEIKKAGDYLLNLINELLDRAKLESGKIKIHRQSLDASAVINELIGLLKSISDKNNIEFFNRMNPNLPNIWADPTRFRQIMINFLSNAIKYNRENGSIIVSSYLINQNTLRIGIKDTGVGIETEQITMVFEAFERGSAEKTDIEGTGIGLNVCKQLAELMDGSVGVYSHAGNDSFFWLDIPLDHQDIVEQPVNGKYKMLYIEQGEISIDLMRHMLKERDNCMLLGVPNLNCALKYLEEQTPDVIVINACSFNKNYLDFLTILKNHHQLENTPIVGIFDKAVSPAEIKEALQAGFYDYITQPFDFNFAMVLFDRLLPKYKAKSFFAI
jgi:signal transduction histidine kinase